MRCFLRLEEDVEVGLWIPGLVFCCFVGGRRDILLEVEAEDLLFRAVVVVDKPDLEDLLEDFLPFTDGLTAIASVNLCLCLSL